MEPSPILAINIIKKESIYYTVLKTQKQNND